MAIKTCKAFKAEKKRLDANHANQRKPFEDELEKCSKKARKKFDDADKDTPAKEEAARDRLERDGKKCRQEFDTAVALIDQQYNHNLDQLWQEGHDGLGFTEHLIIAWKELESDALIVQKLLQAGHRYPRPIIFVESFDDLARELKVDRCAVDLTLVAVVKENALVLKGKERSFAALVTDMTPTTNLKVDEILHVRGRQIGRQPSVAANSGLKRFQGMLKASVLVIALDPWRTMQLTVRNKQWQDDPVVDCVPSLKGRPGPIGNPTDSKGKTTLAFFNVPDAEYQLVLTPSDSSTDPAGPKTKPSIPPKLRVWEPLQAEVEVKFERIVRVAPESGLTLDGDALTADLQPVWMRSPLRHARPPGPTMIVVHHTGTNDDPASLLKTWTTTKEPTADYTICPDGQTIKLVMDFDRASHAGWSYWKGQVNPQNNEDPFGIEIMRVPPNPYKPAQMASLIRLLKELLHDHPTIKPERIIGHGDIATTENKTKLADRLLDRRTIDPGPDFNWEDLRQNHSLGIPVRPNAPAIRSSDLLTFFDKFPTVRLHKNDDDTTLAYGGKKRNASNVPANLIATLQSRLQTIGYSCVITGHYNRQTELAVGAFQTHFVQDEAKNAGILRQVTRKTATMIERVV
jgi:N-acetylmuramoyl-L-alanine amidase